MRVFKIVLSLSVIASFLSCKRTDEVVGPKYVSATDGVSISGGDFKVLTDKDTSVFRRNAENLVFGDSETDQKDTVYFWANITEDVSWKIDIVGVSSGAKKTLIGNSQIIDYPFWTGESDNIYFFRKGENVTATLSFIGSDFKKEKTLKVTGTKLFEGVIILADFEEGSDIAGLIKATQEDSDGWFQYFDVEGDDEEVSYGLGPNDIIQKRSNLASTPVEPVQGSSYFHIRGKDNATKVGSFFIGGIGHDPLRYGLSDTVGLENIFINFFANSNGNKTTKFIVEVRGINGDIFTKEMQIDWVGWRLISVRLSDFVQSIVGDNGIGFLIPSQIKDTRFVIHSAGVPGNIAEVNIDYVTFTYNSPFKQQ